MFVVTWLSVINCGYFTALASTVVPVVCVPKDSPLRRLEERHEKRRKRGEMQRVCQQSGENAKQKSRGTPSYLRAAWYRVWSPLLSLASSSSTLETEEEEVVSAKLGCGERMRGDPQSGHRHVRACAIEIGIEYCDRDWWVFCDS